MGFVDGLRAWIKQTAEHGTALTPAFPRIEATSGESDPSGTRGEDEPEGTRA